MSEADSAHHHNDEFYVRYYAGHKGRYGLDFMEFELYPSGHLRYANHSNHSRKEVFVSPAVVEKVKRMIETSNIIHVNDTNWKDPDLGGTGKQELECRIGSHHIAFTACEIGSLMDIQKSSDPSGLRTFYFLTQDLKALVLALISIHFKSRPIP